MNALRWLAAVTWLGLALVALAIPAAGLCLGQPRCPEAPAGRDLRPAIRQEGSLRRAGTGTRQQVGAVSFLSLAGDPWDIGAAHGRLAQDELIGLEGDLLTTFRERVPSFPARHLLLGLVGFNNRTLPHFITPAEQAEIAAASLAQDPARDAFRALGPIYQRALHYHALHDISQYLIDNPLVRPIQVGCSAFAAWGPRTPGGGMVVGRLFDFEGGPRFDLDKLVIRVAPQGGHRFLHVAWAGMTGGVTGFNDARLWVSVNAAATDALVFQGRPIVLAVREILEHCATIDEALAVLRRTPVFVSDGVLLASAREGRAVVAELGPHGLAVREGGAGLLRSTNHFLEPRWGEDRQNRLRMERGTTAKRYARLGELLAEGPIDPARAVAVLRDRRGPGGRDLGFNHRGTVNAWIGAHLAVADLERGVLWVAEPRHGLGTLRAFTLDGPQPELDLPADAELARCQEDLAAWLAAQERLQADLAAGTITERSHADVATMQSLNPDHFMTSWLAGLVTTEPAARRALLTRALAQDPAYPEDAEAIQAALDGHPAPGPEPRIP